MKMFVQQLLLIVSYINLLICSINQTLKDATQKGPYFIVGPKVVMIQ